MTAQLLPTPVPHRGRGTVLALLAAVSFSSSGALAKPAMHAGLSPQQVAAARIALAALVLLAGVAVTRPALLAVRRDQLGLLVGYGLLGVAGVQFCYFASINRLPVGISMLLEFTSPVLVVLWARFVRGNRMGPLMWLGTALAMLGLMLIAQVWQGLRLDGLGLTAGLCAAVCSASYYLLGERGAAAHHPLGLVTWGMAIGAAALLVVVPPWTIPVAPLASSAALGDWHLPVWTLLVVVALLSTACAYLLGISSMRHVPSAVASVLGLAEPVAATALAWLLLHESLTAIQLGGSVVLLTGAFLVQLAMGRPGPVPEPVP